METTLQKTSSNGIQTWTPDQVQLIKNTVAKNCTDDEFKLFAYTANKYGFDPLIKQIWCVKYGNEPASIFTGRDGFLHKAHESGQFNGMRTPVRVEPVPFTKKIKKKGYGGKQDEWIDFKKESQLVATCIVYRKDMEHPIEVEVWEEEYSSGQSNWAKMPRTMITKVAESQALRRAFDISGIYSEEEGAVMEPAAPIEEANHVEMISDEMQTKISECKTKEELTNLWNENKSLHKKTYFIKAFKEHAEALKKNAEELPDEVSNVIQTPTDLKGLQEVYDAYPEFHSNIKFNELYNGMKKSLTQTK